MNIYPIPPEEMSEEDVKLNFITPSLHSKGWVHRLSMETRVAFTDGEMLTTGKRKERKRADYILYFCNNKPIAVMEAKKWTDPVRTGMMQAKAYAEKLDVPFAFCSNGQRFCEYDFLTGCETPIGEEKPLDEFPTMEALAERYRQEANGGKGLDEVEEKIIRQDYYTSQSTHAPRYYQRIAVNRSCEAIAKGKKRLLLVMATGTGKTFVAFQMVWRLLEQKLVNKVLYLADRNVLVDQSIAQDFAPLRNVTHKVDFSKDDRKSLTAYKMYFSLYQQLAGGEDEDSEEAEEQGLAKLKELFDQDYFDLVIVDECHRGSAKKDSNWRKILEYFPGAIQVGMTATPKESTDVSNIEYFGDSIYTYSLNDGIKDGFLAPFKVINYRTNIGDGWRPQPGQLDYYGNPIPDRVYNNCDYDYNIIIRDRIREVATAITEYMKSTDRMAKTIVFCANEAHADMMRVELANLNRDMMQEHPDYVVRITGSDDFGKRKLEYFISVSSDYPVIATTSKLLSTGVDCKMVKLIVLDQLIGSMTEFKQIIGRGTRLREKEGKTNFTIMDFRGVTRLFADPNWDGPVEQHAGFDPNHEHQKTERTDIQSPKPEPKPFVTKDGCAVKITEKIVSIYDADGRLLRTEDIVSYAKSNILSRFASLTEFTTKWKSEEKKAAIAQLLLEEGVDLDAIKRELGMEAVDDFDFICHLAYNRKPLTRKERADNAKKRKGVLDKYSGVARQVLEVILDKYSELGIYSVEEAKILQVYPLSDFGKPAKIMKYFDGKEKYQAAIRELEEDIYTDEVA